MRFCCLKNCMAQDAQHGRLMSGHCRQGNPGAGPKTGPGREAATWDITLLHLSNVRCQVCLSPLGNLRHIQAQGKYAARTGPSTV